MLFPAETDVGKVIAARNQEQESPPLPIADARNLGELYRLCLGDHEAVGPLYDQMGFAKVFDSRQVMSRCFFKQAILLRLAAPGHSKRAHSRRLSKEIDVEVQVEKLYRMMDTVTQERIEKLKERVCEETMKMLGDIGRAVFDVTTLRFASEQASVLGTASTLFSAIFGAWREPARRRVAGVTVLCVYIGTYATGLGLECGQGDEKHRIRRFSLEQVLQILRSRPVHTALGIVETTTRRTQPMVKRLVSFLPGLYIWL